MSGLFRFSVSKLKRPTPENSSVERSIELGKKSPFSNSKSEFEKVKSQLKQNITVFTLGFFLTLAKPLSYFEIVYHLNYCHSSRPMLCLLCHLHALKVAEAISFMWFMCINCI